MALLSISRIALFVVTSMLIFAAVVYVRSKDHSDFTADAKPAFAVDSDEHFPSLPPITLNEISFASIPAGHVRVGSVSSEPGRDPAMERMTTVFVEAFEVSTTEITRGQYYFIMSTSEDWAGSNMNHPITNITCYEAMQFCEAITVKTGILHRLPTEPEWEYACRAGTSELISVWKGLTDLDAAITSYHRGDKGKLTRGIKASCNVDTGEVCEVSRFPANRFGLYDMHGNCWEWVSLTDTLSEPPSPLHAPIRGGSAISTDVFECRSANRAWQFMNNATESIGFRVVKLEE